MSEIQIFDPLDVVRSERDEARRQRDEARREVAALRDGQRATWKSGYEEGLRHGRKEGEDENARLAAQLLQDAPIAAAARAYQKAFDETSFKFNARLERDALLDLARAK